MQKPTVLRFVQDLNERPPTGAHRLNASVVNVVNLSTGEVTVNSGPRTETDNPGTSVGISPAVSKEIFDQQVEK